jgi:uncharacterized protein
MIFVDTSVWFAAYVDEELEHAEADALLAGPSDRLVTTDYVVDELLTLLVARGHRNIAKEFGRLLWAGSICKVIWVEQQDVEAAWQIFHSFDDKSWSFTDCVSYAVMKRLAISEAFALNEHFKQFGIEALRHRHTKCKSRGASLGFVAIVIRAATHRVKNQLLILRG